VILSVKLVGVMAYNGAVASSYGLYISFHISLLLVDR
jgi:hypothetical protein